MLQYFKEKMGLMKHSPEMIDILDERNVKVSTYLTLVMVAMAFFVMFNTLMDRGRPADKLREDMTTSVESQEDSSFDPAQELPEKGDYTSGSGAIMGSMSVIFGSNDESDTSIILSCLMVAGVNGVIFLYCLISRLRKRKNHNIAMAVTYLQPLFASFWSSYMFFQNGGRSLVIYLIAQALIPAFIIVRPIFELLNVSISFLALIGLSMNFSSLSRQSIYNIVAFFILTNFLCIARYNERLTEVKALIRVNEISMHDELSGLQNRYALKERVEEYLGRDAILLMMDLDDFKYYNDAFGHDFGDQVIKRFADAIRKYFREKDIFRYGGDEFLVLVSGMAEDDFMERLGKCREDIASIEIDDHSELCITSSCGYVCGRIDSWETMKVMTSLADQNLYKAKRLGKDRVIKAEDSELEDADLRLKNWDQVYKASDMDILTGLPNKVHFFNRISKIITTEKDLSKLVMIYINLENFRLFNKENGFDRGDELLCRVADSLRENFSGDLISRFGEDHFVILTQRQGALDRVKNAHTEAMDLGDGYHVETKSGIAVFRKDDKDVAKVCDRALLACNYIRGKYDTYYRFYDTSIDKEIHDKHYYVKNLTEALENDQLEVYYQPIVRLITGKMCDTEALVRWTNKELGLVSPSQFIPVLEETHMIHRVDCYVIDKVCQDIAYLRSRGKPVVPVSINLSRIDFQVCDICQVIEEAVFKYRVPKELLHFELTETVLHDSSDELRSHVQKIQNIGYEVWMDDFGSGYSSLNILKNYNFNVLKIDMEFLADFGVNKKSRKMLRVIINMAKEMGIQSLVEGVETREQMEYLRSIGCEKAQGYYYARPTQLENFKISGGERIEAEDIELKDYYDKIGRVNLLSKSIAFDKDYYDITAENPFVGLPICIYEYIDDVVSYLTINDEYEKVLKESIAGSLEHSEEMLNDPAVPEYKVIRETFKKCIETKQQVSMEFTPDAKNKYVVYMNCVASHNDRHAVYAIGLRNA